ncbi:Hsp70 family protein, partial [Actinokineospora xionganensis]
SNLVLVPEPVAAAAHFASFPGQTLGPGQALAVYDLGAGTFDVAIVGATQNGFAVLAEAGLPDLGGLDVDQALLEHVGRQVSHRDPGGWQRLLRPDSTADRRAQRALREDVKAAKEALSRHPQTEVPLPEPFDDVLVSRVELEAMIRPGMLRSVELLAATIRSTGLTPDRLVGIYLVGGSSRIPLVATLIAEQLRVVPTSLDQPETAVALGAHHVPQEGVTMRTGDMSSTVESVQRTQAIVPLRTGGFAAQQPPAARQQFPQSGPQRVLPPPQQHRPQPQPQPQAQAHQQAHQQVHQQAQAGPPSAPTPVQARPAPPRFPTQSAPQVKPQSNKVWYLATAVVAVVVIGIVSVIIATTGSSGGLTADCSDKQTDGKGFTPCMREVAGTVATKGDCASGANFGGQAIATPGATSATCKLNGNYLAIYIQFDSADVVDANVQTALTSLKAGAKNVSDGDWTGGGMSGKYHSVEIATGAEMLIYTVENTPIMGWVIATGAVSGKTKLLSYFNEHIKPGSTG